jgi:hypothetical protein
VQARNIGLFGAFDIQKNLKGDFIAEVHQPPPPLVTTSVLFFSSAWGCLFTSPSPYLHPSPTLFEFHVFAPVNVNEKMSVSVCGLRRSPVMRRFPHGYVPLICVLSLT